MSSPIWTPDALSSEPQAYRGEAWRLVEAQHRVSTLGLVDTLDEQSVLEGILDETKPPVPLDCQHLDYLLSTPFRYTSNYRVGSRFRRAGRSPGVFYAAEVVDTAVAEMVFYRYLFFAESPEIALPGGTAEFTAFSAALSSAYAIDLTREPLVAHRDRWANLTDYSACQALADAARAADVDIIRYQSVRDPLGRANVAVLRCQAFADANPVQRQTWRIRVAETVAQAICEHPRQGLEFEYQGFAADARLRSD